MGARSGVTQVSPMLPDGVRPHTPGAGDRDPSPSLQEMGTGTIQQFILETLGTRTTPFLHL